MRVNRRSLLLFGSKVSLLLLIETRRICRVYLPLPKAEGYSMMRSVGLFLIVFLSFPSSSRSQSQSGTDRGNVNVAVMDSRNFLVLEQERLTTHIIPRPDGIRAKYVSINAVEGALVAGKTILVSRLYGDDLGAI